MPLRHVRRSHLQRSQAQSCQPLRHRNRLGKLGHRQRQREIPLFSPVSIRMKSNPRHPGRGKPRWVCRFRSTKTPKAAPLLVLRSQRQSDRSADVQFALPFVRLRRSISGRWLRSFSTQRLSLLGTFPQIGNSRSRSKLLTQLGTRMEKSVFRS